MSDLVLIALILAVGFVVANALMAVLFFLIWRSHDGDS